MPTVALDWLEHRCCIQTKALESLQQRAMKKDYSLSLIVPSVDTLESRREQLTERFFRRSVLRESSCLHYLLPDKRDSTITDRLRHPKTFTSFPIRTEKFIKVIYTVLFESLWLSHVRNSRSISGRYFAGDGRGTCPGHWSSRYGTDLFCADVLRPLNLVPPHRLYLQIPAWSGLCTICNLTLLLTLDIRPSLVFLLYPLYCINPASGC